MANKNIKILYVLNKCPYPLFDGTRERILGEIKFLSQEFNLDVLIITTEIVTEEQLDYLKTCTSGTVYVFYINKVNAYINAFIGLLSSKPIQTAYFLSTEAQNWLSQKAHEYQSIYFHTIRNGQYIEYLKNSRLCPKTKIFISFNDAISLNYKKAKEKATGVWRLIYTIEENRVKKYELLLLGTVDGSSIVSEEDKNYISQNWREKFGIKVIPEITVIRNGLNDEYIKYKYSGKNNSLVFFGNLLYPPNRQGLENFIKKIWPEVLKINPMIKLIIIGRGGDAFRETKNTEILGFVEDPYQIMCEQSLLINPINFGAGVPTKVLLAIALGLPVVAYKEGVLGIEDVKDGENIVLVTLNNSRDTAQKICDLLGNQELRNRISQNGKNLIREKYLASNNLPYLSKLLTSYLDHPASNS